MVIIILRLFHIYMRIEKIKLTRAMIIYFVYQKLYPVLSFEYFLHFRIIRASSEFLRFSIYHKCRRIRSIIVIINCFLGCSSLFKMVQWIWKDTESFFDENARLSTSRHVAIFYRTISVFVPFHWLLDQTVNLRHRIRASLFVARI